MFCLDEIYCVDCVKALRQMPYESVDLVVTSPPYKTKDGYSVHLMHNVCKEIYRVLKPNCLFYLNFGHLVEDKYRPFEALTEALGHGFNLVDTIVWVKTQYSPITGDRRLNNLTEFVFQLSKGEDYHLDRLAIGVPYKDKSNVGRYSDVDLHCGGNVWYMGYNTITKSSQKLHPDRFPLELPEKCIKLSKLPEGAVILDPFMGSGTTALAAKNLGYHYIGFEKDPHYVEVARERLGKD